MNEQYEMPQYSRSKIEKAGKAVSRCEENSPEFIEYLPVVDNWRASHAYALDRIAEIVGALFSNDQYTFVVHRLKRLDSIIGKLKRVDNTGLYRMQDLGGCRVIVDDLDMVYNSAKKIVNAIIEDGHEIVKETDYIKSPRIVSGYRSYHIIVRFHCAEPSFDGMLIEIQVRTKLEHVWATAVEMMDIITEETLKAGTGKIEYMHFFKLVSALFSLSEGTPVVEGINNDEEWIVDEIFRIDRKEQIRDKLANYNQVIRIVNTKRDTNESTGYYLLLVHKLERQIEIIPFPKASIETATTMYQNIEKDKRKKSLDVVLISVNNLDNIKDAYPNYFLMTYDFLNRLDFLCSKYPEKPTIPFSTSNVGCRILDFFTINRIKRNVPYNIRLTRDTVGSKEGEIYNIPQCNMTLEGSYLRFSAPIWDQEQHLIDENITVDVFYPYTVEGAGIVVTRTGGCFYMDKDEWSFVSEDDTMLVQLKDNTEKDLIKILLCWMKSNLFEWDLLWNYHSRSASEKNVVDYLFFPDFPLKDKKKVVSIVDKVISMETDFVKSLDRYSDGSFFEIDDFNQKIADLLIQAEGIFEQYYGINDEYKSVIQQELSIKGYYTYE